MIAIYAQTTYASQRVSEAYSASDARRMLAGLVIQEAYGRFSPDAAARLAYAPPGMHAPGHPRRPVRKHSAYSYTVYRDDLSAAAGPVFFYARLDTAGETMVK